MKEYNLPIRLFDTPNMIINHINELDESALKELCIKSMISLKRMLQIKNKKGKPMSILEMRYICTFSNQLCQYTVNKSLETNEVNKYLKYPSITLTGKKVNAFLSYLSDNNIEEFSFDLGNNNITVYYNSKPLSIKKIKEILYKE